MNSSANNSRHNTMDAECDRAASASASALTSPATTETATTISTIVLQSHHIQIVVGILQVKIKNASSFDAVISVYRCLLLYLSLSLVDARSFSFILLFICFSNMAH